MGREKINIHKFMKKKLYIILIIFSALLSSCFEDLDDNIQIASDLEIKNFIYRGLNYFYLYKEDSPELANDAFADQNQLNEFLNTFESPENLFSNLQSPQDRFSILVDNYIELENALSGITKNNGMEFGLVFYPDGSNNVFGYARYILPGTDAETKGLERGIIFNTIDGQQINDTNFSSLLAPDTYTIGLATIEGESIIPTGDSVELVKQEYTENPIYIAKTFTIEGQKVGYLMYNAFTLNFDPQLNAVFAEFLTNGVTDIILDLRYNGGGSVETAVDLSSMITGQFNGQIFVNEEWNSDRQDQYAEPKLFNNVIHTGEAINSLFNNRVYVITTGRSASASELVINGLDPYIDVIQVGGTTTGKFQASFLLYDAPAPNFRRSEANPGHTYAMLPLVFKTVNVNGITDFIDGLEPEIAIDEDYSNLGILGEVDEPLLAAALNEIFPTSFQQKRGTIKFKELSESKANLPSYQLMVDEN